MLSFEVPNLRSRTYLEAQARALDIVHDEQWLQGTLDETMLQDFSSDPGLDNEVRWRADHLRRRLTFEDLVRSDMPCSFTQYDQSDSEFPVQTQDQAFDTRRTYDVQLLSRGAYADVILVRNWFRCIETEDGM